MPNELLHLSLHPALQTHRGKVLKKKKFENALRRLKQIRSQRKMVKSFQNQARSGADCTID